MTHLLTTIGSCPLSTMVVVSPSTTEAMNFMAQTAAQGGNLGSGEPEQLESHFAPRVNDLSIYVVNSEDVQNYDLTTVAIASAGVNAWNLSVDGVACYPGNRGTRGCSRPQEDLHQGQPQQAPNYRLIETTTTHQGD